jgi:hypothetical protein
MSFSSSFFKILIFHEKRIYMIVFPKEVQKIYRVDWDKRRPYIPLALSRQEIYFHPLQSREAFRCHPGYLKAQEGFNHRKISKVFRSGRNKGSSGRLKWQRQEGCGH